MKFLEWLNSETESTMVVARGLREGDGEFVFNGYRVSIWEERVLEMGVGDGYTRP